VALLAIYPNVGHKEIVAHDVACLAADVACPRTSDKHAYHLVVDPNGCAYLKLSLDLGVLGKPLRLVERRQRIVNLVRRAWNLSAIHSAASPVVW